MGTLTAKLDNARRLRGTYFIDPDGDEYKEIIDNARKKLEVLMDATHPTRFQKRSTLVYWNPMNPQGNEWNHPCRKITKITSQANDTTR